jgi:membrane protein implicated in regulation of membrane protease activity
MIRPLFPGPERDGNGRKDVKMSTLFWIWLAVAAIFLIVELSTPSLVFASFVAGALGAAIAALLHASYLWQGAVFALVDRPGIVTKMIDPDNDIGQVRVDGQVWQAVAPEVIKAGEKIVVNEVRGARLYVTKSNK